MPIRRRMRFTLTPGRGDLFAFDDDPALVDRLQEVHAAQQRRLPGAGRADQAHDLVLGDGEIDPAQDLERPEGLVETVDDERLAHQTPVACRRRRSRSTSQSVKRASGIVNRTKRTAAATNGV